jgi:hypothetical protein
MCIAAQASPRSSQQLTAGAAPRLTPSAPRPSKSSLDEESAEIASVNGNPANRSPISVRSSAASNAHTMRPIDKAPSFSGCACAGLALGQTLRPIARLRRVDVFEPDALAGIAHLDGVAVDDANANACWRRLLGGELKRGRQGSKLCEAERAYHRQSDRQGAKPTPGQQASPTRLAATRTWTSASRIGPAASHVQDSSQTILARSETRVRRPNRCAPRQPSGRVTDFVSRVPLALRVLRERFS